MRKHKNKQPNKNGVVDDEWTNAKPKKIKNQEYQNKSYIDNNKFSQLSDCSVEDEEQDQEDNNDNNNIHYNGNAQNRFKYERKYSYSTSYNSKSIQENRNNGGKINTNQDKKNQSGQLHDFDSQQSSSSDLSLLEFEQGQKEDKNIQQDDYEEAYQSEEYDEDIISDLNLDDSEDEIITNEISHDQLPFKRTLLHFDYNWIGKEYIIDSEKIEPKENKFCSRGQYIDFQLTMHQFNYLNPLRKDLIRLIKHLKENKENTNESYENIMQVKWELDSSTSLYFSKKGLVVIIEIQKTLEQKLFMSSDENRDFLQGESLFFFLNLQEKIMFAAELLPQSEKTQIEQSEQNPNDVSSLKYKIQLLINTTTDLFQIIKQFRRKESKQNLLLFKTTQYYLGFKFTYLNLNCMKKYKHKINTFKSEVLSGRCKKQMKQKGGQIEDQISDYPHYGFFKSEHQKGEYYNHISSSIMKIEKRLDKYSKKCLKYMMTTKLAIIQGPPGTGKSYLALEAVMLFLKYYSCNDESKPILVICKRSETLTNFLKKLETYIQRSSIIKLEDICKLGVKRKENQQYWDKYLFQEQENKNDCDYVDEANTILKFLLGKINLNEKITVEKDDLANLANELTRRFLKDHDQYIRKNYNKQAQQNLFNLWVNYELTEHNIEKELSKIPYEMSEEQKRRFRLYLIELHKQQQHENSLIDENDTNEMDTNLFFEPFLYVFRNNSELIETNQENFTQLFFKQFESFYNISYLQIQSLREYFLSEAIRKQKQKLSDIYLKMMQTHERYQTNYLQSLRDKKIILTTLNQSQEYYERLRVMEPEIIIIDEAAEIFESDIVHLYQMNPKHVIQFGDRSSLQPRVFDQSLSKKQHCSQFERLFSLNFPYKELKIQRRMTQALADYVRLFQPEKSYLDSNEKYEERQFIFEGSNEDVFFITHDKLEERDKKSIENLFEVFLCIRIAQEIILKYKQDPSNITITTMYKGQMYLIKDILQKYMKNEKVSKVNVYITGSFQGDENDIIIFSFVRSNKENEIGLLKEENRVIAAFSRARKAAFYVGNFLQLSSWQRILDLAKQKGHLNPNNKFMSRIDKFIKEYNQKQNYLHQENKFQTNSNLSIKEQRSRNLKILFGTESNQTDSNALLINIQSDQVN